MTPEQRAFVEKLLEKVHDERMCVLEWMHAGGGSPDVRSEFRQHIARRAEFDRLFPKEG